MTPLAPGSPIVRGIVELRRRMLALETRLADAENRIAAMAEQLAGNAAPAAQTQVVAPPPPRVPRLPPVTPPPCERAAPPPVAPPSGPGAQFVGGRALNAGPTPSASKPPGRIVLLGKGAVRVEGEGEDG